jgi:hypothetical protein
MTVPLMERPEPDRKPWGLILALVLALTVGLIGLPLQFVAYKQIGQAAKAQQIQDGQRALCEQLNDLARQARLQETDCTQINGPR